MPTAKVGGTADFAHAIDSTSQIEIVSAILKIELSPSGVSSALGEAQHWPDYC